jgi:hypothetical protein
VKASSASRRTYMGLFSIAALISVVSISLFLVLERTSQPNGNQISLGPAAEALSGASISRILFSSRLISKSEQWSEEYWVNSQLDQIDSVYLIDSRDGVWLVYEVTENSEKLPIFLNDPKIQEIMAKPLVSSRLEYSGVEVLVRHNTGSFFRWADLHLAESDRSQVIEKLYSQINESELKKLHSVKIPIAG